MKKTLLVAAMAAVCAVFFTACPTPEEKTTADYLMSPKKGWILQAATSSPAYELLDGSFATDLINDGYLHEYELDDIMTFTQADGFNYQIINPGNNIDPEGEGYQQEVKYLWAFDAVDEGWIYMQVPFFYDDVQEYCQILKINDEEFRFKCTVNDDDVEAKGTYSFTLTYVPAK